MSRLIQDGECTHVNIPHCSASIIAMVRKWVLQDTPRLTEQIIVQAVVSIGLELELSHVLAHFESTNVLAELIGLLAFIDVFSYLWVRPLSWLGNKLGLEGAFLKSSLFWCSVIFITNLFGKILWESILLYNFINRELVKPGLSNGYILVSLIWLVGIGDRWRVGVELPDLVGLILV